MLKPTRAEFSMIRLRLAYQFNWTVANALLPDISRVGVSYSGTGKIRYVYLDGELILTMRPGDGLFAITPRAGEIIVKATKPPDFRVIVRRCADIRGSVLVKDLVAMDPNLRVGDEVVIVDEHDNLIGVGKLRIPYYMLSGLNRGEVARVRRRVVKSGGGGCH